MRGLIYLNTKKPQEIATILDNIQSSDVRYGIFGGRSVAVTTTSGEKKISLNAFLLCSSANKEIAEKVASLHTRSLDAPTRGFLISLIHPIWKIMHAVRSWLSGSASERNALIAKINSQTTPVATVKKDKVPTPTPPAGSPNAANQDKGSTGEPTAPVGSPNAARQDKEATGEPTKPAGSPNAAKQDTGPTEEPTPLAGAPTTPIPQNSRIRSLLTTLPVSPPRTSKKLTSDTIPSSSLAQSHTAEALSKGSDTLVVAPAQGNTPEALPKSSDTPEVAPTPAAEVLDEEELTIDPIVFDRFESKETVEGYRREVARQMQPLLEGEIRYFLVEGPKDNVHILYRFERLEDGVLATNEKGDVIVEATTEMLADFIRDKWKHNVSDQDFII